jgi:hypothetical protein
MLAALVGVEDKISNERELRFYLLNKIIFILLSFILWIDALTGMIQFYGGFSIKLSLLFKLPLIFGMLMVVSLKNRQVFSFILIAIACLFIGPGYRFLSNPKINFLVTDFSMAIKVVTPFITFYYCKVIASIFPNLLGKYGMRALWFNFYAVLFNLFIGVLGFGYPSYPSADGGPGIGINGFYVAGNELSGCFVLLFGFVLHCCWNYKRFYFYPMAFLSVICAALIATKTAMFASLLLVFLIPIVNERKNVFRLTKLKLKLFVPLLIASSLLIYFILDFIQALGLYDKITWILQEKGVLGLILSGRVEFSTQIINAFMAFATWFEYLFGIGTIGMSDYFFTKYAAEVDPVDLFVYFGVVGSLIAYFFLFIIMHPAFSMFKSDKFFPPIIVLVNIILVMLAFFSGHIMNSGMLGLLWGLFNSLVFIKPIENSKGVNRV